MIINKISIDNIKGISHLDINYQIYPNRPNIFVAPNGFGKSSFATAFLSVKSGPIDLKKEECFNEDITRIPKVIIEQNDSKTLIATNSSNSIISDYQIHVANNQLIPNATAKHFSGRTIATASLDIKPTILLDRIPPKEEFPYKFSSIKRAFGSNGKILTDLSNTFNNYKSLQNIENGVDFHIFSLKKFLDPLNHDIDAINKITGTSEKIKNDILHRHLLSFSDTNWIKLVLNIKKVLSLGDADAFLCSWQYIRFRSSMGDSKFKKALNYSNFLFKKKNIDDTLKSLNPVISRFDIKSKIEKNKLIIYWPKAHQISNGQRDILVFIAQLIKCEYQSTKNCILVIDEFFDYLDDANLVAFQYYVSSLIDRFKREKKIIFPILLTHLDPNYLKHFCFNDSKLNVCYLIETKAKISPELIKLVKNREEALIKNNLDTYFFHFNPNASSIDISSDLNSLGLNSDWGKPDAFRKKNDRQLRVLLYDQPKQFDPLAICFSVRLKIEENIYNKLTSTTDQSEFLNTHGTKDKLHYAESKGVSVPETYHLLGIIYNHPLHDVIEDMAKPLSMKLENPVILNMIKKLWD